MEGYNSSTIREVTVDTTYQSLTSSWNVSLKVYFEETPHDETVFGVILTNLTTDVDIITGVFDEALYKDDNGELVASVNFTVPAVSYFTK